MYSHEQRLHARIGEPFPAFREGEIAKAARMAEEGTIGIRLRAGPGEGGNSSIHSQQTGDHGKPRATTKYPERTDRTVGHEKAKKHQNNSYRRTQRPGEFNR